MTGPVSYFAVVNNTTKLVENVVVPPDVIAANIGPWFAPAGCAVVETTVGQLGDTYDASTGAFTPSVAEEAPPTVGAPI